jgi:hypothetical protein
VTVERISTDNTIRGLSIGAGGVLGAAVTGSPFAAGIVPVGIAIDPSNSTFVVANLSGQLYFHLRLEWRNWFSHTFCASTG